jgi:glutamate synthase domain-containing protein 2
VKVGATRTFNDVKLAVHAGADVVVVDGMQGGTAATQTCFIEHIGIPTLAAVRQAVDALEDLNMKGKVQLIVSGGIRSGADVAKALAMGADAVAIGQGILWRWAATRETYPERRAHVGARAGYDALGTAPGFCHHCHTGKCPVGVTTQDAILEQRLQPDVGARRVRNYLKTLNMELTTIARACGKQNVHHLEREDLVALTAGSRRHGAHAAGGHELDSGPQRILMVTRWTTVRRASTGVTAFTAAHAPANVAACAASSFVRRRS